MCGLTLSGNELVSDPYKGVCVDTDGSFECSCNTGYRLTETQAEKCDLIDYHEYCVDERCVDIDECATGVHNCPVDYNCYNHDPHFKCCDTTWDNNCSCPRTYFLGGNQVCYPIVCREGYVYYPEGDYCIDLDECAEGTHTCSDELFCVNGQGDYTCMPCPAGFELGEDGVTCQDINECEFVGNEAVDCQAGVCVNLEGSYECQCDPGFEELTHNCRVFDYHEDCDTKTCINIDECTAGTHNCDPCAYCYDMVPFFKCCVSSDCSCPVGYYINEQSVCVEIICIVGFEFIEEENQCRDIDECQAGTHDCPDDQFCVNDVGSYTCQLCQTGFETNVNETRNCLDIHESELGTHTC